MTPPRPRTLAIMLPVLIAVVFLTGAIYLMHLFSSPMDPSGREKIVLIRKGLGVKDIGRLLEKEGIIKGHRAFNLLVMLHQDTRSLRAGEYRLSPAMSMNEVLDTLKEGRIHYRKVTIPEGYTLKEIAAALEREGLSAAGSFLAQATDPVLVARLGLDAPSMEGYLFPETYYFTYGVTGREIIETMLSALKKKYPPDFQRRAQELGMSMHQVLTLASIIEEEAAVEPERPIISGVFHNRLKRGMPLQADPTVRYALGGYRGALTEKMMKTPSPYNTYLHPGLPPGPISSPGISSIKAALYPEKTPYIYFVAGKDGTHKFSSTLREHNRAVRALKRR